jgi:hypothetical protein
MVIKTGIINLTVMEERERAIQSFGSGLKFGGGYIWGDSLIFNEAQRNTLVYDYNARFVKECIFIRLTKIDDFLKQS